MALTISTSEQGIMGNKRTVLGSITFDSSYATGGESFDKANIGLVQLDRLMIDPKSGYLFEWDSANAKIKVRQATAAHSHTENTAAAYTQNASTAASTAAVAGEVANATDLSAVTTTFFAVGV